MSDEQGDSKPVRQELLDPVSRLSEILFGLLMVLTFTGSFSVASDGESSVHELLIASIGCNLAWGMVDGCMLLLNRLAERGRAWRLWQQLNQAPIGSTQASELMASALPPLISREMLAEDVESLHRRLQAVKMPSTRLRIGWLDLLAALSVFLLVFLSTLPVVLPFVLFSEPLHALRLSNAIALVMLFLVGLGYGRFAGTRRPWLTALVFTVFGVALVSATIALGG